MWISKKKYEVIMERIIELEEKQNLTFLAEPNFVQSPYLIHWANSYEDVPITSVLKFICQEMGIKAVKTRANLEFKITPKGGDGTLAKKKTKEKMMPMKGKKC